jgi:hypothetical protein
MTELKLLGRDKAPDPEQSENEKAQSRAVSHAVPGSYCPHRSVRAVIPSPINGMPQAIESPLACRRDCMHYIPDTGTSGIEDPWTNRGSCDLGRGAADEIGPKPAVVT